jgi:hypothetical protein
MSKLKEIIHQYVVEALQEILDEEHNPEVKGISSKSSGKTPVGYHQTKRVLYRPNIINEPMDGDEKPKKQTRPMSMRSEEVEQVDEGVEREDRLQKSVLNDPTNQDKRDALSRAVTKNVRRKVKAMRNRLFVPKSDDKYDD